MNFKTKPFYLRYNKLPYLQNLSSEINFNFRYQQLGRRDIKVILDRHIVMSLAEAKRLTGITQEYDTAKKNSNILFSLYAANQLTVSGFLYPTYHDFKQIYRDYTLDHILPKKYFPHLTFEISNLKPESLEENIKKADDLLTVKDLAIAKIDELLELIESYSN